MAVTLQQLMESHTRMREMAASDSPMESALNRIVDVLKGTSDGVRGLQKALYAKEADNIAARRAGGSSDVQDALKKFLKVQQDSDKLASERSERIAKLVQDAVPQVTEEQLRAVREQQLAYREHRENLRATLNLEQKKFDLQKKLADREAEAQIAGLEKSRAEENFAITDKYGTIEKTVGDLGAKAQDPLSKFLVDGLQRFVKERKEAPVAEEVKKRYDTAEDEVREANKERKAEIDHAAELRKEDIEEEFAVRAARDNVFDPGSAAKLYEARTRYVQALVSKGVEQEIELLKTVPETIPTKEASSTEIDRGPGKKDTTTTREPGKKAVPTTREPHKKATAPITKPSRKPQVAPTMAPTDALPVSGLPKGARLERASVQRTSPQRPTTHRSPAATRAPAVTPATGRPPVAPMRPASTGPFGSKAGFVNPSGLGSALPGISKSLGSIAGSAVKFLGPWALIANSLKSFDRLVPVISDGAGALMDLSKLIMPMSVSMTAEGFAQLLGGINGIIDMLDHSWFGRGWHKDKDVQSRLSTERASERGLAEKRAEAHQQSAEGGSALQDTTSAPERNVLQGRTVLGRGATLTTPMEAVQPSVPPVASESSASRSADTELARTLQSALMESRKSPGTTPIMMSSPVMTPWFV